MPSSRRYDARIAASASGEVRVTTRRLSRMHSFRNDSKAARSWVGASNAQRVTLRSAHVARSRASISERQEVTCPVLSGVVNWACVAPSLMLHPHRAEQGHGHKSGHYCRLPSHSFACAWGGSHHWRRRLPRRRSDCISSDGGAAWRDVASVDQRVGVARRQPAQCAGCRVPAAAAQDIQRAQCVRGGLSLAPARDVGSR